MWKTAVIFPAKCGSKSVQLRFLRRHIHLSSAAFKSTLYDTSFSSYCQYFTCGYLPFWCGYFSVSLRLFFRARAALAPVFTTSEYFSMEYPFYLTLTFTVLYFFTYCNSTFLFGAYSLSFSLRTDISLKKYPTI